ncbi:hypothetical protein [Desulfoplanes sp.]
MIYWKRGDVAERLPFWIADGLIAYLNQRIGATQAAAQKAGTEKTASSPATPAKLNYTQKRDFTDLQRYTAGIRKNMDIAVKAAERMDKGEIEQETRSLWAKKCPGEPILTFRFCDKDWQHKKGVDGWWSAGTFHAEKYDRSTLDYYVIVDNKDGKTATQWICSKIKDNLANTSRIVLKNSKYAKQVMLKDKLGR